MRRRGCCRGRASRCASRVLTSRDRAISSLGNSMYLGGDPSSGSVDEMPSTLPTTIDASGGCLWLTRESNCRIVPCSIKASISSSGMVIAAIRFQRCGSSGNFSTSLSAMLRRSAWVSAAIGERGAGVAWTRRSSLSVADWLLSLPNRADAAVAVAVAAVEPR